MTVGSDSTFALQISDDSTTRDAAQIVAESLEFFYSFLGASCVALECKGVAAAKFLCQALAGHQAAIFYDAD